MAWTKLKTVAVVAVAVVIGTIMFLLTTMSKQAPGRLLDGTRVVLEKVGYGTNYSPPKPMSDRLLRHLPASWLQRIKWNLGSGPSGTADRDIFLFWLRFSSPAAADQAIGYAIADEGGFEAAMIFGGRYGAYQPSGFGTNYSGLVRGAGLFPRRSKSFRLRLYQQDGSGNLVRVAEFPIRNPGFRREPSWKPHPLPSEWQTNGLVLTLTRATVGTRPPGQVVAPYSLQAGEWSEFRFRVTEQGKPSAGWMIREMWISDAIGKPIRVSGEDAGSFNGQFSRTDGDEIVCFHHWDFWADEPAWKVRVHFEHPARPGCWAEYLVRPEFLPLAAPAHVAGRSGSDPPGGRPDTGSTGGIGTRNAAASGRG
jgi:hypothetical protein